MENQRKRETHSKDEEAKHSRLQRPAANKERSMKIMKITVKDARRPRTCSSSLTTATKSKDEQEQHPTT
jgi:hypothetical protein